MPESHAIIYIWFCSAETEESQRKLRQKFSVSNFGLNIYFFLILCTLPPSLYGVKELSHDKPTICAISKISDELRFQAVKCQLLILKTS
jgi:hypothetical protein